MNVGDIYRVYGTRVIGSADVVITKVTADKVYIKRLIDGAVVETDRGFFENMRKENINIFQNRRNNNVKPELVQLTLF